jgi:GDP-4-dehydro-6-deoxy-D-mannose reductase
VAARRPARKGGATLNPGQVDSAGAGIAVQYHEGDIREGGRLQEIVAQARPTHVFHLAGATASHGVVSDPEALFRLNMLGTINLLDAVCRTSPGATVLVAGSSACYGPSLDGTVGLTESAPHRPVPDADLTDI